MPLNKEPKPNQTSKVQTHYLVAQDQHTNITWGNGLRASQAEFYYCVVSSIHTKRSSLLALCQAKFSKYPWIKISVGYNKFQFCCLFNMEPA